MFNLAITQEQFEAIYPGVDHDIFTREPHDEDDLWANFMTSKLWRLNNLYTIANKDGDLVRFSMNYSQHVVYGKSLEHPRLIILKSRQQGISTLWLVSFFDDAMIFDNFEIGLMTQGQKESRVLFRRVKRLWDELPQFVKTYIGMALTTDTKEELGFSNGARMYLQTSFRSGTLQRLHISEFGKISAKYPEKAQETKTGSLQAIKVGNTVIVESTAEGRKNAFYAMWYEAADFRGNRGGKDFMPVFLPWMNDPDCNLDIPQPIDDETDMYFASLEGKTGIILTNTQKWWYVSQRRELGDSMGQEYPGTPEEAFAAVRDGAYYAVLMRELEAGGRVMDDLYDPALQVNVAMDLGVSDTTVLIFFQLYNKEVRIIGYYENNGEGLSHYTGVMFDKNYHYKDIWAPHDIKVKELGSGKTRLARLRELGVRAKVLKRSDVATGIERVRRMFPNLYIDSSCDKLITVCYSYSRKWNETLGSWSDTPLHDQYSNGADALRYVAMSLGNSGVDSSGEDTLMRRRRSSNVVDGMAI